ncbi:MAG: DUF4391 domain-containing protein [Bryobacteraceae bacterium]|nr:DUF4391 domain-containing protein [Bryobacteraceae bacterium]
MSFEVVINALAIPRDALVGQRVPKKLLVEQGAPTAADKRRITDGIEELHWVAALKPTNIGVPAFKDAAREYLEVSVLTAALRPAAMASRLIELIHRAIPYPLLLISAHTGNITLSVAHKRWSQGEAGKVVVEDFRQIPLNAAAPSPEEAAFLESLAISQLPARDLFALYEGWLNRLVMLEAARITGSFRLLRPSEHATAVQDGLSTHAILKRDIALLRAQAQREKQVNRLVELNIEIKRLEAELHALLQIL